MAGKKILLAVLLLSYLTLLVACGGDKNGDIAILGQSNSFVQSNSSFNNKVDILWIIDSSGSMAPYQTNLATSFNHFITNFTTKGYDYHMAIGSTDAWVREHNYNAGGCSANPDSSGSPNVLYTSSYDCNPTLASYGAMTEFRDGDIYGSYSRGTSTPGTRSGVFILDSLMNPSTVISTFGTNAHVNIRGDGVQESTFQSLRALLRLNGSGVSYGSDAADTVQKTMLANFRRSDAFLAIVAVSDEEDQSTKDSSSSFGNYDNFSSEYTTGYATTEYANAFVSFLDQYTGSTAGNRTYNVSAIFDTDVNNCAGHDSSSATGYRYASIVAATNGVSGSICQSDFSSSLDLISSKIVQLSTRFKLSQQPDPTTIVVQVNGVTIPQDPANGWQLVDDTNTYYIVFNGTSVPPQGASIVINFTPTTLQ